jgi:hypothetical protein
MIKYGGVEKNQETKRIKAVLGAEEVPVIIVVEVGCNSIRGFSLGFSWSVVVEIDLQVLCRQ